MLAIVGLTLGVIVLVMVAAILLPPVRQLCLGFALGRLTAALPGELHVTSARWPALGRIEVHGVEWTHLDSTLAAANEIEVALVYGPLLRRDLILDRVKIEGLELDVPAIAASLRSRDGHAASEPGARSFPRGGSLPGLPSIAVRDFDLDADWLRTSPQHLVSRIRLVGMLDTSFERTPRLRIENARAEGPADSWRVDSLALDLDLERGVANGGGRGRLESQWPMSLDIAASGPDRFTMRLQSAAGDSIPIHMGIRADMRVVRRGVDVDSLLMQAIVRTPGTTELARFPAIAARLRGKPETEGLVCTTRGALVLHGEPSLRLETEFLPHPWLKSGRAALIRSPRAWELHGSDLQIADLRLNTTVAAGPESLMVRASLEASGTEWLAWVHPRAFPPIELRAAGEWQKRRGAPIAGLRLEAQGSVGKWDDTRLQIDGELGLDSLSVSKLQVHAARHDMHLRFATEVQIASTIQARFGQVVLDTRSGSAPPVSSQGAGVIRYTSRPRRLQVDDLQLRGSGGDARLSGDLDADNTGTYRARFAWPEFPALLERIGWLGDADSLRAHWGVDAPFWLELDGRLLPGGATSTAGSFHLPGPRTLAAMFRGVHVDSLGPLAGTLQVDTEKHPDGTRIDVRIDGGRTAWVDSLRLYVEGTPDDLRIHAATACIESTRVDVHGAIRAQDLDLGCTFSVAESAFLRTLVARPELTTQLDGEATLLGPRRNATFTANARGDLAVAGYNATDIVIEARRDSSVARAQLVVERGVTTPWVRLEQVRADWSAGKEGALPSRLSFLARGQGLEIENAVRLARDGDWSLDVESLRLVLADKDLRASHPFRILLGSAWMQVDSLDLTGGLGSVRADGRLSTTESRFETHVALDLPETPPSSRITPALWPRRARIELLAETPGILHMLGEVTGVRMAGGAVAVLQFDVTEQDGRLSASVALRDSSRTYCEGTASSPTRVQLYPPRIHLEPGPVTGDVRFTALPFAFHTTRTRGAFGPEDVARVGGRIVLGGTTTAIAGRAQASIAFPDSPHLADYVADLVAQCGRDARADSIWGTAPRPTAAAHAETEEVAIELAIRDATAPLVNGSLSYPLRLSLAAPYVHADTARTLALRLLADALPLAVFDFLMPRGATLAGTLAFALAADGRASNPRLAGTMRTSDVELLVREDVRIVLGSSGELSGTKRSPRIAGRIDVRSGLIKVPESQKNLHPSSGESVLLPGTMTAAGRDPAATASDTLETARAPEIPADSSASAATPRGSRPDVDVTIDLPRGLAVRGRGLDVEVAGRLQVTQQGGKPVVAGELRAVRGTYTLVGRTLGLDRGTVRFQGDDSLDPALDIQLSTLVSSTKILVVVGGTTQKPELSLHSEPEMEQTDIIALLSLGKTFDQLSDEESNILRERAAAIVLSMGAAALQENVAGELGIDVLQYRSNSAAPGGTSASDANVGSLAFGKYLSPKLLLSYAYSLDRATDDVLSLEYFLSGRLTLETLYSVGGETGLGFGWTKEY